jgi:hypothetical protein
MKKNVVTIFMIAMMLTSCYVEWDVPKVPRHDPCSGKIEQKYVYVNPTCATVNSQLQVIK